jgi:omega-hydroxy-beta-dihydromenaquinone-9 sulfotransferase
MPFDFRLFLRSLARSFSAPANSTGRWTLKRFMSVTVSLPVYLISECIHWLGLLLDEILFPGYRKVEVRQPVFIVGVPRSGTTFLHRVMARDEKRFSCMRLWEVLFAPSIVEKKLFLALDSLDRALGGPGKRLLIALEKRRFRELGKMHKLSLFEPEEDDPILIHIHSSLFLSFAQPFPDLFRPLALFDTELPEKDRRRIMDFYRACVQRHLYVFGKGRQFLSKNPAFSPKVESLNKTFPDCKIVCTVRDPAHVVPSLISLLSSFYGAFCDPPDPYPERESILEMLDHWYRYPVERLEKWPRDRATVLPYDRLVAQPDAAIRGLYQGFGFEPGEAFESVLTREAELARQYKSLHEYSLDRLGLDSDSLRERFADVYRRFGFGASSSKESPTFSLGHPPTINLDKALTIASALEDDEISLKLTARK